MSPTFFHAYQTLVFLHNTINETLRYTKFPSNLSLSTVCLRKIWLKTSVSTSSILSAVLAVRGRPLQGRGFEAPVYTINLANNLIQSTTRLAFMRKLF